jgi:glutamate-1-semialdehyde 2,1-aminomutase
MSDLTSALGRRSTGIGEPARLDAIRLRAQRVTPGGTQTRAKGMTAGNGPSFICRGEGALAFDIGQRSYVDWMASLGAATLGHAHPAVVAAVMRQVRDGVIFSRPHPLEFTVAERLLSTVMPRQQDWMVRWVKTGSEACSAALRVARARTGRDVVLIGSGGYHGWHDWAASVYPDQSGVPRTLACCTREFRFNDADHFERSVCESGSTRVAAVLVEPMRLSWPQAGFLEHLRRRTREIGAALIFDETLLGLRLARGGGGEYFDITPDLAVFGKALAGGLPLAGVIGPAHIMQHASVISSTFGGDALALAAADAVLDVYEREDVVGRIWRAGMALRQALEPFAGPSTFEMLGPPVHMVLRPAPSQGDASNRLSARLAENGILLDPAHIYPSAALSPAQIAQTAAHLAEACAAVFGSPRREP